MTEEIYEPTAYFDLCRFDVMKISNPRFEKKEFQRKVVKSILKKEEEKFGSQGNIVCVIDSSWLRKWRKYVEYDQHAEEIFEKIPISSTSEESEGEEEDRDDCGHPGRINNIGLIENPHEFLDWIEVHDGRIEGKYKKKRYCPVSILKLKNDVVEFQDFEVVPSEVWEFLLNCYGGFHKGYGPSIPRYSHLYDSSSTNQNILYPSMVPCSISTPCSGKNLSFTVLRFSNCLNYEEIEEIITWFFGIPIEHQRDKKLWIGYLYSPWQEAFKELGIEENLRFRNGDLQLILESKGRYTDYNIKSSSCYPDYSDYHSYGRKHFSGYRDYFHKGYSEDYSKYSSSSERKYTNLGSWDIERDNEEDYSGISSIINTFESYRQYNCNYLGSLFHCLSKTKCLINFFLSKETNFEKKIVEFCGGIHSEEEYVENIPLNFGEAMMMMWSGKYRFIILSGLDRSIPVALRLKSPLTLLLHILNSFQEDSLLSKNPSDGKLETMIKKGLIEENFDFKVRVKSIMDGSESVKTMRYLPVRYEQTNSIEELQSLENLIRNTRKNENEEIEILSLPKYLIIAEETYNTNIDNRMNFQSEFPPSRVHIPEKLNIHSLFGKFSHKFSHYELYALIYHIDPLRDHSRTTHFCKAKVPVLSSSFSTTKQKKKKDEWYNIPDSNNSLPYRMTSCDFKRLERAESRNSIPIIWFYEGKRSADWDDPELLGERVMYLVNQSSVGGVLCNLKLSFQGFQEDVFFQLFSFI